MKYLARGELKAKTVKLKMNFSSATCAHILSYFDRGRAVNKPLGKNSGSERFSRKILKEKLRKKYPVY
jgi:hypothetical protein